MATRAQSREAVIGLLYAYDIGNKNINNHIDVILENKKIRNNQKKFAIKLFEGVVDNLNLCDNEIKKNLQKRGIDDLGSVEKAILRLAVHEILFTSVDKAVAINEAIELSKRLANDNSPKFINGLLDKIDKTIK